jgi:thioredoxin reductase (NADPH)
MQSTVDMIVNPAIPEALNAAGAPIEADAVIVGAGPVGLFQVFELGLLEIKAHVIDALVQAGGQPIELYPDKPIYDIPAIPVCTGQELTDALLKQCEPFKPTFHLGQVVTQLAKREDGRFDVETSAGTRFISKTVFIAGGVGAFEPRKPKVEGITQFEGNGQLAYRVRDPKQYAGKNVVILGGGDSALDWALNLQPVAAEVALIHRRDDFRAAPDSVNKMRELVAAGKMKLHIADLKGLQGEGAQISGIQANNKTDGDFVIPCDTLLAFYGLTMKLGPIANFGLNLHENLIPVDTEKFETQTARIFSIGDINWYPGKLKLILSGFHEAALMAQQAFRYVYPDKKLRFQYTTSSSALQEKLGVGDKAA